MHTLTRIATAIALAAAAACGGHDASQAAPQSSDLPERFYLAQAPSGAVDVGAAHASAKDGEQVTVRGSVGGSEFPFVEGVAAFTIVDPALKSCENDGMDCPTPWDYCCVDPAALVKGTAMVEVTEGGQLLKTSPRWFHGLDHLVTVVVQGTAKRDANGNLSIAATGIHPQP